MPLISNPSVSGTRVTVQVYDGPIILDDHYEPVDMVVRVEFQWRAEELKAFERDATPREKLTAEPPEFRWEDIFVKAGRRPIFRIDFEKRRIGAKYPVRIRVWDDRGDYQVFDQEV